MKFLIKQIKSFRGAVAYIFDRGRHMDQPSEYICSSRLSDWSSHAPTLKEICEEYRKDNLRGVKYPAASVVLFFDKEDVPKLTRETLERICRSYMDENGMGDCRYVCVRHYVGSVPHIHIVSSTRGLDGELHFPSTSLSQELMKRFDREEGFVTREVEFHTAQYRNPAQGHHREVDYLVGECLRGVGTRQEGCWALERNGIHPIPHNDGYNLFVQDPDGRSCRYFFRMRLYLDTEQTLLHQENIQKLLDLDPFNLLEVISGNSMEEEVVDKENKEALREIRL